MNFRASGAVKVRAAWFDRGRRRLATAVTAAVIATQRRRR